MREIPSGPGPFRFSKLHMASLTLSSDISLIVLKVFSIPESFRIGIELTKGSIESAKIRENLLQILPFSFDSL